MSDTPCVDGCGQDAATIERLERSRAVAVRQLGEALGRAELDRAERAEAAIERARDALDSVGVLHPVAADRVLRALDGSTQDAAGAPEAPGQPGRGEGGSGGRTGALARVLDPAESFTDTDGEASLRVIAGVSMAERILADPGPLLEALAEAGVLHVEDTAPFTDPNGETGHVGFGLIAPKPHRRYVTEWEATDARP